MLRGLLLFVLVYLCASWSTMLAYDTHLFPIGPRIRYLLLNSHAALVLAAALSLHLLGEYVAYRLKGAGVEGDARVAAARRVKRLSWIVASLAFVAAAAATLSLRNNFPLLEDGLPQLRPSSTFHMDTLSRRPTIRVTTNEHGFRDRPWDPPASPDEERVLLVGDSIVFGSGIADQRETLTPVLQDEIHRVDDRMPVEVFNLSLLGLNFHEEVALLAAHARDVRPRLVVVVHNEENDLMPVLPYYRSPVMVSAFPLGFISFVNALDRLMGSQKLSERPGALDGFQRDVDALAALADAEHFDVLFLYVRGGCPPPYYRTPRIGGRRFMFAVVGGLGPENTFPNDFHPNPAGVRELARRIAPLVVSYFRGGPEWAGEGDPITADFVRSCLPGATTPPEASERPDAAPSDGGTDASAGDVPPVWVLSPAVQDRIVELVRPIVPGGIVAAGYRLESVQIEAQSVQYVLSKGDQRVSVVLRHPDAASEPRARSASFAITVSGELTDRSAELAVDRLARAVQRNDQGGYFSPAGNE